MALKEKLNLLHLSDDENKKAVSKFLATLSLVSVDELNEIIAYLKSHGIEITHARELKVFANSKDELAKKISILEELGEAVIYSQDPTLLNRNVIDIYKKIKYCRQIGKPYKKEDGTYEAFLFNEIAWQREFNSVSNISENKKTVEDIVTMEPNSLGMSAMDNLESSISDNKLSNPNYMDINEYKRESETSNKEINNGAKTTDFATVRQELQNQLAELDALKNVEFGDDEISFNDLEPESYGMGR